MDWQRYRNERFAESSAFDKNSTIKKQAGIDSLTPYLNYFEIQTLGKLLNKNDDEVFQMNDVYATKILLGNTESVNFENKFSELKLKQV